MSYHNAYAALVDDQNIVRQVIVIPYCNDNDDDITIYCNSIGLPGTWLDTSYLGNRRGKFAGIGDLWTGTEFVTPPMPQNNDE